MLIVGGTLVANADMSTCAGNPGSTYLTVGETQHFKVSYDSLMGAAGQVPADGLLSSCEFDYARLKAWFGGVDLSNKVTIELDMNTAQPCGTAPGGGVFAGQNDEIHCVWICGADLSPTDSDAERISYARSTSMAEVAEIFMHAQNKGWNSQQSNGEALSRLLSDVAYGDGRASEEWGGWLEFPNPRPDWLTTNSSDLEVAISCATLFILYLRSQLGFTLTAIITVGGNTLNDVYRNLTNDPASPFDEFSRILANAWPPFPVPSGLGLSLRRFLEIHGSPYPSVRDLVAQANVGNVRALMNTQRSKSLM